MYNKEKEARWNPEAFLKMYNLKYLRITGIYHFPTHLPDDLKILEWNKCPSKSLPTSFQLDELIQLCLPKSQVERLWIGRKVIVLLSILPTLLLNFKGNWC